MGTITSFPSRALWSFVMVARTVAACSPPITEIREFGHMNRKRGLREEKQRELVYLSFINQNRQIDYKQLVEPDRCGFFGGTMPKMSAHTSYNQKKLAMTSNMLLSNHYREMQIIFYCLTVNFIINNCMQSSFLHCLYSEITFVLSANINTATCLSVKGQMIIGPCSANNISKINLYKWRSAATDEGFGFL